MFNAVCSSSHVSVIWLSHDPLQDQQEEKGADVTGIVAAPPLPMNPLRESLEEGGGDGELKEEESKDVYVWLVCNWRFCFSWN